jgi:hypothetical protein
LTAGELLARCDPEPSNTARYSLFATGLSVAVHAPAEELVTEVALLQEAEPNGRVWTFTVTDATPEPEAVRRKPDSVTPEPYEIVLPPVMLRDVEGGGGGVVGVPCAAAENGPRPTSLTAATSTT